jgi:predicted DNA-binding transcriptional regulator YafY
MQHNKNIELRYLVLDRCFSDFRNRYSIEELIEEVNDYLSHAKGIRTGISIRQIRSDINTIRKMLPDDVYIDAVKFDGKKCYYRYSKRGFSIYKNELSVSEVQSLRSTIEMLGKFRGLPSNRWLEDVISKIEVKFGMRNNSDNLVSFGENEHLAGYEFLSDIIDATINHQPLKIKYITARNHELNLILHPYFVKQYNERWFIFGLNQELDVITNIALDRICDFEKAKCSFIKNDKVDFKTFFDNIVGVSMPSKELQELTEIKLKFSPHRFKYVITKPIHKSQKTISESECTISINVYPTKELEQQLFSFGPDIEILSPAWYREDFSKKISDCMKKYFSSAE